MMLNSRGVALLLATAIALVTLAFTSLVQGVTNTVLFVTTIISFSASYILSQITLDFFIFREINNIYKMLDNLRNEEFGDLETTQKTHLNPLKRINQEIASYAQVKEKEINELRRIETFRREFLADISHELKTPIFAAQGFVHTLLDGAVKDKTVRKKFLRKAAKSLDGLNMLVQDLLTISQMEIGEVRMHPEDFNIYEVIADVIDQFEGKSERKNVTVQFAEGCPTGVSVLADPQRIYQVMANLISNAIKYNHEGGHVIVDLEVHKTEVVVFVKDDGPGIPPEHIKRIFERFYRVEKSRSKDRGGTGLGLAIVKHIIEAHDSKVAVTSTMGKGTTFSFKLPKGENLYEESLLDEPEEAAEE